MSQNVYVDGWKISRPYAHWQKWPNDDYEEGTVYTPQGIVVVVRYGTHNSLRCVHNGRCHVRSIDGRNYSRRYLVTLANRFVAELLS